MEFSQMFDIVKNILMNVGSTIEEDLYDGIIVKELAKTNILDPNRDTTNQSHIAITGELMDMFPYIRADKYFEETYENADKDLKKYFVAQIPVYLHKENLDYMSLQQNIVKESEKLVYVSIIRGRRKNQADQIQMSILDLDSPEFVQFRKMIPVHSYMIILKRKEELIYDMYVIKQKDSDVNNYLLQSINNHFGKKNTKTAVKLDKIYVNPENKKRLIYKTGLVSEYERDRIIFGAPGTGKSFTANQEKDKLLKNGGVYERVTFHPDYSYANFVGTYKPVPCADSDMITYEYVPGPFMRTLVKALKNAQTYNPTPHLLIIEEINRANVAAVFGDVFQLLDREENEVSEYPIRTSEDMKKYLSKELNVPMSECEEIRIPNNMFIWATMNSADQGVFPMDTAFKRRWDFTYLGINSSQEGIADKTVILGTGKDKRKVKWNELRKAINEELLKYKVNEDKLMGPYFISKKYLGDSTEINSTQFTRIFKNKVLMYLFDDAAKQRRTSLFAGCSEKNLYSAICDEFDTKGVFIFCDDISKKFTDRPEEE